MATEPLYLLINLDRSRDRLAVTGAHLHREGITFTRIPAVDGKALSLPLPGIDPELYKRRHGRSIRPGEIGCYLSHMRAMRTFLASPHRYCVILEDDAEFARGGKAAVEALVEGDLMGFDVVRLQLRRWGLGFPVARLSSGHSLKVMATRMTGSLAYVLSRPAASRYLARLLPLCVPFDHAFDRPLHLGLSVGFVSPAPVVTAEALSLSTIEPPRTDRRRLASSEKVGLIGKFPVLRWRTETEIARALAASSQALRRRLIGTGTCRAAETGVPPFPREIEDIVAPVAVPLALW